MAIVVKHTPMDALYSLSTQAGQAQYEVRRQEKSDAMALQGMQQQHEMRKMAFMAKQQDAARAEEMQYNMMLMQAKRQIDMQTEMGDYARDKQKLSQLMSMINDSDHSDKEKEDFKIQAMSKYADVGSGLTPASFGAGGSKGMQDFLMKGAYRTKLAEQVQGWVDDETISPQAGQRMLSNYGMNQEVTTTQQQKVQAGVEAQDQFASAQKQLRDNFMPKVKKGKIQDRFENWHKEGSKQYAMWETMNTAVEQAQAQVDRLHDKTSIERMNFDDEVAESEPLQKLVDALGPDEAFAAYKADKSIATKQSFSDKHPILKTLLKNSPPGMAAQYNPANLAYEGTKKLLFGDK